MKRRIALFLFLFGILGCAHAYHWAKAEVTSQAWTKDSYECERSATEQTYFERAFMGLVTVQNFFDQCLLARG